MFIAVPIQACSHCIGQIIALSALLYLAMHGHFQREEYLNILGAFHLEIFLSHDSLPIGTSEALRSQSLNGVPELSLDKAKVCQVELISQLTKLAKQYLLDRMHSVTIY